MKKQFNLEAALNGEPFECEDGSQVLKWMYCEECEDFPVGCYIKLRNQEVELYSFTNEGYLLRNNNNNPLNLVMSPKNVTRWFNVYANKDYGMIISSTVGFESEQDAKEYNSDKANYMKTIPIEIELP